MKYIIINKFGEYFHHKDDRSWFNRHDWKYIVYFDTREKAQEVINTLYTKDLIIKMTEGKKFLGEIDDMEIYYDNDQNNLELVNFDNCMRIYKDDLDKFKEIINGVTI